MTTAERPWSATVRLEEIGETGRHVELEASEPVRAALAKPAGVDAIERLVARFNLTRRGRDKVHVSGEVSGTVRQDNATGALVADAAVEVLKSGTLITDTDPANVVGTGKTDASGAFKIAFLLPGTYELRATPPSTLTATYNAVLKSPVTISTGAEASGNLLVLPHK